VFARRWRQSQDAPCCVGRTFLSAGLGDIPVSLFDRLHSSDALIHRLACAVNAALPLQSFCSALVPVPGSVESTPILIEIILYFGYKSCVVFACFSSASFPEGLYPGGARPAGE